MRRYKDFNPEWNDRQNERPLLPLLAKLYRLPGHGCDEMGLQHLVSEMPYLILCAKILLKITPEGIVLVNTSNSDTVWVNGELVPKKAELPLKRNDLISTRSLNWVITDHDSVKENPFRVVMNNQKTIGPKFYMHSLVNLYERINKSFEIHVHDTSLNTSEQNYMMRKFYQDFQLGNFQILLEETGKLIEGGIEDTEVYNMHGLALEEFDRFDEALQMYQRAIKLEPDHPGILHNMKRLGDENGRWHEERD